MTKRLWALILVMLLALSCASPALCEVDDDVTIAFCDYRLTGGTLPQKLYNAFVERCDERGWNYEVSESIGDTAVLLQSVENWTLMDVDLIIAFWTDEAVALTVQQACDAAGIPFILIGCEPEGVSVVSADNREFGRLAGEKTAEAVKEKWNGEIDSVLLVEMSENGLINELRMGSALDALLSSLGLTLDDVELARMDDVRNQISETQQRVTDTFAAHPYWEKTAVICFNALENFIPACNAIISEGLGDKVLVSLVAGFDEASYYMLHDYDWVVGIGEHFAGSFMDVTFEIIERYLAGEDVERKVYHVPITWLDKTNMNDYSYL